MHRLAPSLALLAGPAGCGASRVASADLLRVEGGTRVERWGCVQDARPADQPASKRDRFAQITP